VAIVAREPESKFTPAPEGLHQAVCVDVVELGLVKTPWGEKEKVEIVWQLDAENDETGKRFEVRKWYGLSLHEKANLRKDLECWRGRKFTKDELTGFDLEKLIGANCQLQVIHNITDEGKTFANVQAIVPHNNKVPKIVPLDYTRRKDRAKDQQNGHDDPFGDELRDDPVPF
jgi:hypothetical protein